MKGRTKIELVNTKTGEVKVIEKHNIVTNWLKQLYTRWSVDMRDSYLDTVDRTLFCYDQENMNKPTTPLTEFGGVIVFREQLTENANNYTPTGNYHMTAHASSDGTYAGSDLTMGSFNVTQSSYDIETGEAKLVFDFNQDQANGTLGTVCLCNHNDGKIGLGSQYDAEDSKSARAPYRHHLALRLDGISSARAGNVNISIKEYLDEERIVAGSEVCEYDIWYDASSGRNRAHLVPVWFNPHTNKLVLMDIGLIWYKTELHFYEVDLNCTELNPLFDRRYSSYSSSGLLDARRIHLSHVFNKPESSTELNSVRATVHTAPIQINVTDSGTTYRIEPTNGFWCYTTRIIRGLSGLDFEGNFWYTKTMTFRNNSSQSSVSSLSGHTFYWTANTAITFTKVNLETFETTDYQVTNTTGHDIFVNGGFRNYHHYNSSFADMGYGFLTTITVANGYLFVRGNDAKLYAINLSNNSDVHVVKWEDDTDVIMNLYSSEQADYSTASAGHLDTLHGWVVDKIGDHIVFNQYDGVDQAPGTHQLLIVGTSDFIARKLNTPCTVRSNETFNTSGPATLNDNMVYHRIFGASSSDAPIFLYRDAYQYSANGAFDGTSASFASCTINLYSGYKPLRLLTINALDEQVTKTADMTMRITYTLTLDDDESTE